MDETRIACLEAQLAQLGNGQHAVEERLCRSEVKLDNIPSKEDLSASRIEKYKARGEILNRVLVALITFSWTVVAMLFALHHWSS